MERVVRLFSGGLVHDNREFVAMKENVLTFMKAPCYNEVVSRVMVTLELVVGEFELEDGLMRAEAVGLTMLLCHWGTRTIGCYTSNV